jgi:uncharacterized membrane protein YtjA (UPF0391 family)
VIWRCFARLVRTITQELLRILGVLILAQIAAFEQRLTMLGWALTFLVVALIAAILGFGGIAGFAVEIAKIIFFVAIVLFAISAIIGLTRGRAPTVP